MTRRPAAPATDPAVANPRLCICGWWIRAAPRRGAIRSEEVTMFTKIILSAFLAACGVQSSTEEPPAEQPDKPPDDSQMDQHFCCQSVDHKSFSGNGCSLITELQVALCNKV